MSGFPEFKTLTKGVSGVTPFYRTDLHWNFMLMGFLLVMGRWKPDVAPDR